MDGTLAKSYSPLDSERAVRASWDDAKAFHASPGGDPQDTYTILIPPPNVTSALHLGHAFNNTLQDILVRVHRMKGASTLWMPGTDHAGIATQTVVERRLLREGKRRTDFTRDAFIERVQAWKDQYETTIVEQLVEMGASCDFDRLRFTMDDVCAAAVREAFFRLFSDGLIYRGKRLVNWDPATQTALADDEVEMEEIDGHMWYLNYPLEDGSGSVTVATTRPETMLGDTAVAMNPKDPRAEALRGKNVVLPIVGRVIPIIEDDFVVLPSSMSGDASDPKATFATGFLKVTPAHDPNDWDIGQRHDLEAINILAPDASISKSHGFDDCSESAQAFIGMSREDAREAIVAWFKEKGELEEVREYTHAVGHSYRSHVPIEPYLSDQWYVRVTDEKLAGAALRSLDPEQWEGEPREGAAEPGDGGLRFSPPRYAKTFQSWHENIRDWCISRQLWWGHQIPVWTRVIEPDGDSTIFADARAAQDNGADMLAISSAYTKRGAAHAVRMRVDGLLEEHVCVPSNDDESALIEDLEAEGFERDPDVLDTWFSSALWPLSTLGGPEPGRFPEAIPEGDAMLATFNPTSVLCTAREIITLWVSRMVMMNRYFLNRLPFTNVYIHAMIQDGHGQKMSKSLGNGVDPRDIISSHGADALRFTLTQIATATQDVRMPVDIICPHTGETFEPEFIRTDAGYFVAAPIQKSPGGDGRTMVSSYGAAMGEAEPSDEVPLATNTSSRFDLGRNFCNKLWNAVRFALSNLEAGRDASDGEPALIDRWILSRVHRALHVVEDSIDSYQFSQYADQMYALVWKDFCDWYLEGIKPTVKTNAAQQATLFAVLDSMMRMLHPMMPFVTETLWPHLHAFDGGRGVQGVTLGSSELCATAPWPDIACSVGDNEVEAQFEEVQALVLAIRNLRGERQVKPSRRISLHADKTMLALIDAAGGVVETMAGIGSTTPASDRPTDAIPVAVGGGQVFLSDLVDAVDLDKERARLDTVVQKAEGRVAGLEKRLSNPNYVQKAKPELVQETRDQLVEAEQELLAAQNARSGL